MIQLEIGQSSLKFALEEPPPFLHFSLKLFWGLETNQVNNCAQITHAQFVSKKTKWLQIVKDGFKHTVLIYTTHIWLCMTSSVALPSLIFFNHKRGLMDMRIGYFAWVHFLLEKVGKLLWSLECYYCWTKLFKKV